MSEQVYVHGSKSRLAASTNPGIEKGIFYQTAIALEKSDKGTFLMGNDLCRKTLEDYLIKETNKCLRGLSEKKALIDMKPVLSHRQIGELLSAFKAKSSGCNVSANSMILLHVLYGIHKGDTKAEKEIMDIANEIVQTVQSDKDGANVSKGINELVVFLLDCYQVLMREMAGSNTTMEDFPSRPRIM